MDLRILSILSFLLIFGVSADISVSNDDEIQDVSIQPNFKEGLTGCWGRLCSRKLVENGRASSEFKFWSSLFNVLDKSQNLNSQFTNLVRQSNGFISWDFFFKFLGTSSPRGGAAQYRQAIEKSIQWIKSPGLPTDGKQRLKTLAKDVLQWRKGDPNLGKGGANSHSHVAHMQVIELWEKLVKSL